MSPLRAKAPPEPSPREREVLRARFERLRKPAEDAEDESQQLWVAEFILGGERYALPLAEMRASVPLKRVTPVPLSAAHVIGILRFQGQVISALSLASLLGGSGWRQDPEVLLIVDPGMGHLVALDCETIPKPAALPARAVEQARASATGAVVDLMVDGQQLHLINLARLLDRRRGARDAER
jgi:purine-binding chemotaxis protein CheW